MALQACKDHWQLCQDVVDELGLSSQVSKDGDELATRLEAGEIDPLYEVNQHFSIEAVKCGGVYLLSQDTQYCPFCEFTKHVEGFSAKEEIVKILTQIRSYLQEQGKILRSS